MAALNFPDPNVTTSYTNPDTGITYEWANGIWKAVRTAQTAPELFVDVDGDNLTGNLTLGTDKIVLNATDGSAAFAGRIAAGSPDNGTATVTTGYALTAYNTSATLPTIWSRNGTANGPVFLGVNAAGSFTTTIKEDGSASFAGRLSPGTSSLNDHALVASNNNAANATLIAQNYNDSGLLFKGYNSSNETININADGSATFAGGDIYLDASGFISSERTFSGDSVSQVLEVNTSVNKSYLRGYVTGTGTNAFTIQRDGSATFAGDVDINGGFTTTDGVTLEGAGQVRIRGDNLPAASAGLAIFRNGSTGTSIVSRINYDGSATFASNVGIGNSSPSSYNSDGRNLVVGSGSGGQGLSIASGTSSYGTIYFADGTSGDALYRGSVLYNHASDFMRFDTAATERMRIASDGNVSFFNGSIYNFLGSSSYSATTTLKLAQERAQIIAQINPSSGLPGASLQFLTMPNFGSPTERMRIDSSGNVGINQSSPDTKLDVNGAFFLRPTTQSFPAENGVGLRIRSDTNRFQIQALQYTPSIVYYDIDYLGLSHLWHVNGSEKMRIDSSGKVGIGLTNPGDYHANANSLVTSGGITFANTTMGSIHFADSATGTGEYVGQINYEHSNDSMQFITNNSERMRLTGSGQIFMNCTSQLGGGYVQHLKMNSGTGGIIVQNYGPSNTAILFRNSTNTGTVGYIATSDTSISIIYSSDYRLKENVVDITDGITRVKQLQPRRFNFIADADTTVDGFLAHEAQTVVPEAVIGTKDEVDDEGNAVMQGIDKSKLVPLLTAALQEAIAKIETLEQRLSDAGIA